MISVIVPISESDEYLRPEFNKNLLKAMANCKESIEVIFPKGPERVKNLMRGAELTKGDILVFTDIDNIISPNFLKEVETKSKNAYFTGGGVKDIRLERKSIGILFGFLPLAIFMYLKRITLGAFWVKRKYFYEVGGFNENRKYYDIDFALRLKKFSKKHKLKFESLKECYLIWSTRKFDKYGDWHWLYGYRTD